jgi:hypothetical protein
VKIGSSSRRGTDSLPLRWTPMTGLRRIVVITPGSTLLVPSWLPTGPAGSLEGGAGLVGVEQQCELLERHGH